MQQLTAMDATFLHLETPAMPMHIGSVSIYDPSTAPGGSVSFKQIMENAVTRGGSMPTMNNRILEAPLSIDLPYWIADEVFDPEFHIRHIALPQPGDWRQFCIQIARLHSRPLDRSRPLWEMYVIEGLDKVAGCPKGCFAVYTKVHHAAIDGVSGMELAAATHDLEPDPARPPSTGVSVVKLESAPGVPELLFRAQLNAIRKPKKLLALAKEAAPGIARFSEGIRSGKLKRVGAVPFTRFNENVTPHRVFDSLLCDFEDIRTIKNMMKGVTVNDVVLAICGGALNKYLTIHNELPDSSLAALAPINVRSKDSAGAMGNQVSQMTVLLHTDIDDPIRRLAAVNQGTRDAKELTNAIGAKTMANSSQFIPTMLLASASRLSIKQGPANRKNPTYNCVVSNVPGLQIPVYFNGAKMLSSYGQGPLTDGNGLFHAVSSYCGQFTVAFTSCRQMMPDPAVYAQCLRESFNELLNAANKTDGGKKI